MTTAPALNTTVLRKQLAAVWPGLVVQVLDEVDSTNTRLLQSPAGTPPMLLVALHQTQGRGRMGRRWHSEGATSLTFSMALPLSPPRWDGLSLAVGLALAEALDPCGERQAPQLLLKWPNDLWLLNPQTRLQTEPPAAPHARKLGGVLIETAPRGAQRWCVVGVGLNLRPATQWAASPEGDITHGLASLHDLNPALASLPAALAAVALPLATAISQFERDGWAPLQAAYARRDALRGLAVSVSLQPPLLGHAQGVDGAGALLLRHAGGLTPVHSGEVSVRLQGPPTTPATPQPTLVAARPVGARPDALTPGAR